MKTLNSIKMQQIMELQQHCMKKGIEYSSIESLLDDEKKKKLQKRNHYIQQSIDIEIEKSLGL